MNTKDKKGSVFKNWCYSIFWDNKFFLKIRIDWNVNPQTKSDGGRVLLSFKSFSVKFQVLNDNI